jgi:hypothetical protein
MTVEIIWADGSTSIATNVNRNDLKKTCQLHWNFIVTGTHSTPASNEGLYINKDKTATLKKFYGTVLTTGTWKEVK